MHSARRSMPGAYDTSSATTTTLELGSSALVLPGVINPEKWQVMHNSQLNAQSTDILASNAPQNTPNISHLNKASLHFCSECNNLLYPKADPLRRIMVYACRICAYDEIGENQCVYRNDLLTVTK